MSEEIYRPLIEDMVWSYTRINTFDQCPYQFFLRYIEKCGEQDKFFATYGTFIHKLIERYYKKELSKEEMLMEFLTEFQTQVVGERPNSNTTEKYIKAGAEYLRNFEPFPYEMEGVEKRVDFTLDGLRYVGYIDYLGKDDDGELVIVDNKSRDLKPRSKRKKPTVKDNELDSMLKQLYIYAAAVQQEYGRFPKELCFNCFKAGVCIKEPFHQEAFDATLDWAKTKIEEIKSAEDFPPNIDYFYCRYICGVSEDCMYAHMKEVKQEW